MTAHRMWRLLAVAGATLLVVAGFEILKTLFLPRLALWESHIITITAFTLAVSALVWRATRAGRLSEAKARVPFIVRRVTFTALLTFAGMLAYESAKQALHPDISLWESHLVTIVFSTLVATVAAYLALRRYERLNRQLCTALSESRRAREALQESEERYRSLVQNAGEGICTLDADGRFRLANPACDDIFGVTHGALIGRRFDEFLETGTALDERQAMEIVLRRPDGERRSLLVTSVSLHELGQDRPGSMRICVDITEQRKSAEAVGHVQRLAALGMMAGGVAHEFNNVHFAVLGCLDLAMRQPELPARSASLLETARGALQRASEITRSLLSFANTRDARRAPTAINDVVREVLDMLQGQLQAAGVRVTTALGELPSLPLDRGQISQVVMNLAINAQHAMGTSAEKRLEVATGTTAGRAFIRVSDSGCGIPDPDLPKIFQPFFSTKGAQVRGDSPFAGVDGTGLGLSLCDGIVRVHGGEILVQSVEGRGSTFTVWLPLEARQAPEPPAPGSDASREHAAAAALRGRLLVIDDEEAVRSVLAEMLRDHGHVVETAAGGAEALRALERGAFDLVIVDLQMPAMNGVEFLERLRRVCVARRPMVLVMTGRMMVDDLASYFGLGVFDMLLKPFSRDELLSRVGQALAEK
jgi:two-component system cell cycle sensor histidine kinase/response regulator CckA